MSWIDWINRLFGNLVISKEEPVVQKEEPIVQKEETVDTTTHFNKNVLKKRHSKKRHCDSK